MAQKFYADSRDTIANENGSIGYRTGAGSFDCLGPYAKVRNCPIAGTTLRLTCYATGYADTYFSIPACTRYRGRYISGYFSTNDDGPEFRPHVKHWRHMGIRVIELWKHPAGFGWFATIDGLQDTDAGYFATEWECRDATQKAYPSDTVMDTRDACHSCNRGPK